jgi:hypothetical protein
MREELIKLEAQLKAEEKQEKEELEGLDQSTKTLEGKSFLGDDVLQVLGSSKKEEEKAISSEEKIQLPAKGLIDERVSLPTEEIETDLKQFEHQIEKIQK